MNPEYPARHLETYRILFLGDIVGRPGRDAVTDQIDHIVDTHKPTFVVVNGENSAAGIGITPSIADDLFSLGVDAITLGNHAYNKREIFSYLDEGRKIVRPGNLPPGVPGVGHCFLERKGIKLAIVNLCGRVFMDSYDDPFAFIDHLLPELGTNHVFIDFHAEATSEKAAFGFHVDGRVTAVAGTHTHVQTADECVLERGTAFITDVGMCGPWPSVIGMDKDIVLRKFRTGMPARFEVAEARSVICGVTIDVQVSSGRATAIQRLRLKA